MAENWAVASWPLIESSATWIWKLLNTNFSAALFGALGGSWTAYWLGVRNERRKSLKDEIAATNNAIGIALNTFNQLLSFKQQNVMPLLEHYQHQFERYMRECVAPNPPGHAIVYTLKGDSRRVEAPHIPVDALATVVAEKVNRSTMANMLIGSLQTSAALLRKAVQLRGECLADMMPRSPDVVALLYFGVRDAHGNVNEMFPDTLFAIQSYTDDCIYLSELLAEKLMEHGKALRKAYGKRAPKPITLDFSDPRVAPLRPDRAGFADFERQYRGPDEPTSWWANWKAKWSRG